MDHMEIEVKFLIDNIESVRTRLTAIGAVSEHRHFEKNFRYDDKSQSLLKNRSILRLRKDQKNILTLKSSPPETKDDNFKIHREIEVEVNNFESMNSIIEVLGYKKEQIYEKWRETFIYEDIIFCIDELPYGNFLEIEGSREGIIEMAKKLNLNWDERILVSYLEIFHILKTHQKLVFSDITFENFKQTAVDITKIKHFLFART